MAGDDASQGLSRRRAISRRSFIKRGAAVAGTATVLRPGLAFGQAAAIADT